MNESFGPRISFDFTGRFLPPVYIIVFIIGLIANGWGLKSLLHNWQKLKIINVFVLNLGLADILYLLTPMRVMGRLTLAHSVGISAMVWVLMSVQSLPDMFYPKTSEDYTGICYDTTSNTYVESYLKYSLGRTLTGFCIPLLITLGCYGHMAVVLWTMKRTDKVLKQRSLRLLCILILLFSVCYIPYHVFKNLNLWSRVLYRQEKCAEWFKGVNIAYQISRGLACLNSALNPLVYLHGNEAIPAQLRQLLQQVCPMFSRLPPTNYGDVPMAQIADED